MEQYAFLGEEDNFDIEQFKIKFPWIYACKRNDGTYLVDDYEMEIQDSVFKGQALQDAVSAWITP